MEKKELLCKRTMYIMCINDIYIQNLVNNPVLYFLFLRLILFTMTFTDAYQDCTHLFLGNMYVSYRVYNGGGT